MVGELPGRQRGAPTIVAGHHDGWFGAAFDDATGVAVTLELARAITEAGIRPRRTIAFVSHTAEEYGIAESAYDWCYGAWYQVVAEHREWSTGSPFYLNVEGSGRPELFTLDVPPELTGWVRRACRQASRDGLLPHGYRLAPPNTWTEVWPFLAAGIPGINVSTFTTEFDRTEYHTQYDTTEKVDFEYLARLTEVCARLLLDEPELDFAARATDLRRSLNGKVPRKLERALGGLAKAEGRKRFTAIGRGLHGLDAIDAPRYPHEQTAADVELLEAALADLPNAAKPLARVGLNWLCSDLSHEAFRRERARRRARRSAREPPGAARATPTRGPTSGGSSPPPWRGGGLAARALARAQPATPPRALPPRARPPARPDGGGRGRARLRASSSSPGSIFRYKRAHEAPSRWRDDRRRGVREPVRHALRGRRGVEWWEAQGYRVKLGPVCTTATTTSPVTRSAARRTSRPVRGSRGRRRAVAAGRLRLGELLPHLDFDRSPRRRRRSSATATSPRCTCRSASAPASRRSTATG